MQLGYDPEASNDATISDLLMASTDPSSVGAAGDMILRAPEQWQPRTDLAWGDGGAVPGTEGAVAFIPGSPDLGARVSYLGGQQNSEAYLQRGLEGVARHFDLVLIDTGATAERLSWMTLHAAAYVMSAILPEDSAINGMLDEIDLVQGTADNYRLPVRYIGAICTKFDSRNKVEHGDGLQRAIGEMAAKAKENSSSIPLVKHPAPLPGMIQEWETGPVLWPEVIPQRSLVLRHGRMREPVTSGLYGGAGDDVSWRAKLEAGKAADTVNLFTRLAIRLLQVTDSPVFPSAAQAMTEHHADLFYDEPGRAVRADSWSS